MSDLSLSSLSLPGIGPARLRRLEESGVHTVSGLVALGADGLAALLSISAGQAARAIDAAVAARPAEPEVAPVVEVAVEPAVEAAVEAEATAPAPEEVTEEVVSSASEPEASAPQEDQTMEAEPVADHTEPGPASDELIARLKNAAAMVSAAIAVAGGAEPGKARKRAIKRLKKLRNAVESLAEHMAVTAPTEGALSALPALLDEMEGRLQLMIARAPTSKRLRRARRWARRARVQLGDLLA